MNGNNWYLIWVTNFMIRWAFSLHAAGSWSYIMHRSFIRFWHTPLWVRIAPNVDIILQSGWFWATSVASFGERFNDSRSCWVVFIHVVRGRPGGLLKFSKGEAVKICLASDSSDIRAMWPNRERRRAWCGWYVFRLISSFRVVVPYDSQHNTPNSNTCIGR